jgi:nucleotide-binding universal stress UspA family protein
MKGAMVMRKALVPIDSSSISRSLIRYAFEYARKDHIDRIDFFHVIPEHEKGWDYILAELDEKILATSREHFASMIDEEIGKGTDGVEYDLIVTSGVPYSRIVEKAEEGYSIILIGHRGLSDVERFFIGSVAAKVVRHSPCTVLVYHPREDQDMK